MKWRTYHGVRIRIDIRRVEPDPVPELLGIFIS
jgi:hypothetical protein